ncbi:hypothetical protein QQ045_018147 [Rhodiola kirilowii]
MLRCKYVPVLGFTLVSPVYPFEVAPVCSLIGLVRFVCLYLGLGFYSCLICVVDWLFPAGVVGSYCAGFIWRNVAVLDRWFEVGFQAASSVWPPWRVTGLEASLWMKICK